MIKAIVARIQQGHRTSNYPSQLPTLPDRFRGAPRLDRDLCTEGCHQCADACPTDALVLEPTRMSLDMGRCLFCTECTQACPTGAITLTNEYRLAARRREDLVVDREFEPRRKALDEQMRRVFGRSLKLRQVSAGGCNACEADVNVLGTLVYDLGRFGIQMVASPRHADGILVTGPVTENMSVALRKTYDAVPSPKIVIAVGACATAGGPYIGHSQVRSGVDTILPVDLYVPGCPPHPYTILDGLLGLLDRLDEPRTPATASHISKAENRP